MNRKPAGKPIIPQDKHFPRRGQCQSGRRSTNPCGDGTYPVGFVLSPPGTMPIEPEKRFPRRGQSKSARISTVPAIGTLHSNVFHISAIKNQTKKICHISFLTCKGSPVSLIGQGQAPLGLAGEKSSSLRCGIFPRQTLRNPDTEATLQVRNRNTGSKSRYRFNH